MASLPINGLFEYLWPGGDENGDYYVLEDQLLAFTECLTSHKDVAKSVKHKLTKEELQYVKDNCENADINEDSYALKTDDATLLIAKHFPGKFKSYLHLIHNKEKSTNSGTLPVSAVGCTKPVGYLKKAMKDVADFNHHFNQERREERLAYFDMQTQIIQVPRKRLQPRPRRGNVAARYPVAVIPGQFHNYYKSYSASELNCLPLSTVLNPAPLQPPEEMSLKRQQFFNSLARQNAAGSPSSSSSDDSSDDVSDTLEALNDTNSQMDSQATEDSQSSKPSKKHKRNDLFCGICLKGPEKNKKDQVEELINCSQCENSGHPSCLNMNRQLISIIGTYAWQCMECKTCTSCNNPHDEDQMMFCDHCDRGYHSYCVGLRGIPQGRWVCENCGKCSSCLTRHPGKSTSWQEEFTKPFDGSAVSYLQIHCKDCSRLFRDGNFCPVCLKVYSNEQSDLLMVCCDTCDRWIHTDCDGIDDSRYEELAKDNSVSYKCILCRGEQEERMNSYHRKYR